MAAEPWTQPWTQPSTQPASTAVDAVQRLATMLRSSGVNVSTSEVIDAGRALTVIDLSDRETVRACLRAVMVNRETELAAFERSFDTVFALRTIGAHDDGEGGPVEHSPPNSSAPAGPTPSAASGLAGRIAAAAAAGDVEAMAGLASLAVAAFGDDVAGRQLVHRIMRTIDLGNMLSAAMRSLRAEGELSELELALKRHEIAAALEAFRRALAAEVDRRRESTVDGAGGVPTDVADRPVLALSSTELHELRRMLQPLARQLAARIGRRRRSTSTGRIDLRRTVRRSLDSGGMPFDPAFRRRHPHRPELVLLCDVSGSVAEFARFTFMLTHAIHDVFASVRSFAFVGGVAEMTEVFASASHEVPVQRILDGAGRGSGASSQGAGIVGLDGHSDYGAVFTEFADRYLDDAVDSRTTVIVTGDGRSNFRDAGVDAFARIAARARRTYWLDPEPRDEWFVDDSAMDRYAPLCDGLYEVASVRALSGVIADIV